MKKSVFGRQFKRDKDQRKALFRSLVSSLVLKGSIKTTLAKAKSIKGEVDKAVTHAKKGKRSLVFLQRNLPKTVIDKLVSKIAPKFSKRQGGYTRITKIGNRLSDNAQMALMEWVEGIGVQRSDIGSQKPLEKLPKEDKKSDKKTLKKKKGTKK